MSLYRKETFDGEDLRPHRLAHTGHAGPHRHTIDEHGAGSAFTESAAVFCGGETKLVSKYPEKRCVGIPVEGMNSTVDAEFKQGHDGLLFGRGVRRMP
jgi:hypothetical protein